MRPVKPWRKLGLPYMGTHMSRKSRKAQGRRKWKRQLAQGAVSPADAMHQALGEFLTEMGRVEFQMLLLMDFLNEAPLGTIRRNHGKPFGEKIKSFKTWCDFGGVPDAQQPALQAICEDLDDLLPKRNFLVHADSSARRSQVRLTESKALSLGMPDASAARILSSASLRYSSGVRR
jgi:hypothetical protein